MRYPWLEEYLLPHSGARQDFKPEWQWQRFLVRDLCSRSYRLVTAKLPRKVRAQLEEEASHGR